MTPVTSGSFVLHINHQNVFFLGHSTKCLILYHVVLCHWCCFTNHFRRLYKNVYTAVYTILFPFCSYRHWFKQVCSF